MMPGARSNPSRTPRAAPPVPRGNSRASIAATVGGLHYELVDIEQAPRGLLRVFIDRVPGHAYPTGPGEFITVEDCEQVTRQLQYALEVDGIDYARLEVSSPGLDRPLKNEADFQRFTGHEITLVLKMPLANRKNFKGLLGRGESQAGDSWTLIFHDGKTEQMLNFELADVREARLVPVLDFKGQSKTGQERPATPAGEADKADGADKR